MSNANKAQGYRDPDLKGVVGLITGGSYGVGKGVSEELASLGATIFVAGRSVKKAPPAGCVALTCDHTDDHQVRAAVARIYAEQQRIDILVNNVWGGYEQMVENGEFTWALPFWEQPI